MFFSKIGTAEKGGHMEGAGLLCLILAVSCMIAAAYWDSRQKFLLVRNCFCACAAASAVFTALYYAYPKAAGAGEVSTLFFMFPIGMVIIPIVIASWYNHLAKMKIG
jgi:hypothetical protein